jgi:hypothetical protein
MLVLIGFTGTREGMTARQLRCAGQVILWLAAEAGKGVKMELHHGDCVGADAQINRLARAVRCQTIAHPPEDDTQRAHCRVDAESTPAPYLERNREIVDVTEVLIAAPKGREEEKRSGTWSTVRYARRRGRKIYLAWPDGGLSIEQAERRA